MKDEIKEIIEWLSDKDIYIEDNGYQYKRISLRETKILLDYITNLQTIEQQYSAILSENAELENKITNLQEKLEVSQTNEETYRLEMQDITKILGLDEHTTFDEVKEYANNLRERNNNLKEDFKRHIDRINELTERSDNLQEEKEDYKSRNEKAIDYITTEQLYTNYQWGKSQYEKILKDLLNILQGEDNETR